MLDGPQRYPNAYVQVPLVFLINGPKPQSSDAGNSGRPARSCEPLPSRENVSTAREEVLRETGRETASTQLLLQDAVIIVLILLLVIVV